MLNGTIFSGFIKVFMSDTPFRHCDLPLQKKQCNKIMSVKYTLSCRITPSAITYVSVNVYIQL